MLPTILNEKQIHLFKFYLNGQVQQGMRHDGTLYALVNTFEMNNRLKAYELANSIAEANCRAVVTVSHQYSVWIPLTSSEYIHWQRRLAEGNWVASAPPAKKQLAQSATGNASRGIVSSWRSDFFGLAPVAEAFA